MLVLAVALECVGKAALVAEGKECVDGDAVLGSSMVSKAQSKDPYPTNVTRGYEELDDPETQMQATRLGPIVRDVEMTVFVEHIPRWMLAVHAQVMTCR